MSVNVDKNFLCANHIGMGGGGGMVVGGGGYAASPGNISIGPDVREVTSGFKSQRDHQPGSGKKEITCYI